MAFPCYTEYTRRKALLAVVYTGKETAGKDGRSIRYLTKTLFSQEDLLAEMRDMVEMLTKNREEKEETNKDLE
jgi:hypothetical protein